MGGGGKKEGFTVFALQKNLGVNCWPALVSWEPFWKPLTPVFASDNIVLVNSSQGIRDILGPV